MNKIINFSRTLDMNISYGKLDNDENKQPGSIGNSFYV